MNAKSETPVADRWKRAMEIRYRTLQDAGMTEEQLGRLKEQERMERLMVLRVGAQMGFGRLMQLAEQVWGEVAEVDGHPGSEHTVGPCAVNMVPCVCMREAERPSSCDWCCGARQVTKAVRKLVEEQQDDLRNRESE